MVQLGVTLNLYSLNFICIDLQKGKTEDGVIFEIC